MHRIFTNVNAAFMILVDDIHTGEIDTIKTPSRNGPVIQIPEPVIVTYTNPRERVLFNSARDCNPFFHLYESLWMLAGRNDVAPLKYYVSTIDLFSDDGETFNGAYGYRWRQAICGKSVTFKNKETGKKKEFRQGVDQLNILIEHLKNNPTSRRAVLQMWNVENDLLKIDSSKDVCCNLSVMFSIREETFTEDTGGVREDGSSIPVDASVKFLDMTVTNRSNDLIWGMLGANVVHFSFLQEYVACCLGIEMGVYNQFSNNLHIYTESNSRFTPDAWLDAERGLNSYWYREERVDFIPLVKDKATFDLEVQLFVEDNFLEPGDTWQRTENDSPYIEPFLREVAEPMCTAYHYHKLRDYTSAFKCLEDVKQADWRVAGIQWMEKRHQLYTDKLSKIEESTC